MSGGNFIKNRKVIYFGATVFCLVLIKYICYFSFNGGICIVRNFIFDSIIFLVVIMFCTAQNKKSKKFEKLVCTIIDNIPYPIYYKKWSGEYIECNKAFENLIGKNRKDIIGKRMEQVANKELVSYWQQLDKDITDTPGIQINEITTDVFTKETRDYILRKDIVYDENNKISGIIGVIFDITEMKRTSFELAEAIKQEKTKSDFFSNISHEIRTPINVMLSALQLIEKENVYENKYLDILKENSFRLLRLVNNLIDITKVEAGYCKLRLGNYNIINVIEDIVISVVEYAKANEIEIIFDTDIEERVIACDYDKIERIMLNLVSNAIKFTPKGGKIEVTIKDESSNILIIVKDTGIGIEKQKIDTIFQRFVQVNNLCTGKNEGSGIGLALVKSLVELHNGKIWAESELGVGTTIYVRLPSKSLENQAENESETNMRNVNIELSNIIRTQ
ncbi:MAG: hypothetical protein A2Y24_03970 [Clostridiales bacterium GWE2_32_10]|nr:MAG: hypothetical protein A2Y24_03970 [Clostridiales bacterium GWE2_32_10]